jgi:hypothetical protein
METVLALEVYVGERGYICIKQEDPLGDTQDVVAMLPQQIPAIVRWLQECAAEVEARQNMIVPATLALVSLTPTAQATAPAV